jgi:hypothetical protein
MPITCHWQSSHATLQVLLPLPAYAAVSAHVSDPPLPLRLAHASRGAAGALHHGAQPLPRPSAAGDGRGRWHTKELPEEALKRRVQSP